MRVEIDDDVAGANTSSDGGVTLSGETIVTITLTDDNPIVHAILQVMAGKTITVPNVGTQYSWDYHSDKALINAITLVIKPSA